MDAEVDPPNQKEVAGQETLNIPYHLLATLTACQELLQASFFYVETNAEGIILSVNAFARSNFGGKYPHLVGKHFLTYVHPEDASYVEATTTHKINEPHQVVFRAILHHFDKDREEWIEREGVIKETIIPVKYNGKVIKYIRVGTDITDQIRRNEALEQFASTLSHELRNPLTVINGFARVALLSMDSPNPRRIDLHRVFETIILHTERLNETITAHLTLTPEFIQENTTSLDLSQIIKTAIEGLQDFCERYMVDIDLPSEWPEVYGVPILIINVFSNLISNAIKYGGRPPTVRVRVTDLRNGFIRFDIIDNGRGISEKEQAELFKRLSRLSNAEGIEGTGLGLFIVKFYIELQRGQVGVISSEGKGSIFWFTLPTFNPYPN